jgi:hypothetical protein
MCGGQLLLIPYLSLEEDKRGLWIICLHYDYSKLDVIRKILLGKKCVCNVEERGDYGSIMYSYHCNGKWLMVFHSYCWCLNLLRI